MQTGGVFQTGVGLAIGVGLQNNVGSFGLRTDVCLQTGVRLFVHADS